MKTFCILALACFCNVQVLQAQDQLVPDKQGGFNMGSFGFYQNYKCGYTKAETEAHSKKITEISNFLRSHNPVLHDLKGFVGQLTIFSRDCEISAPYGIPASLRFEFCAYTINRAGKEVYGTIEPPCWYLIINAVDKRGLHVPSRPPKDEPVKPGFDYETYKAAAAKLNEMFYTRDVRKVIAPGLDRYGDEVVVYNPDRPPYWLQVTVEEAYARHFAYWKAFPDKLQSDLSLQLLNQEYATFTEEEKKGYAYAMGKGAYAQVGNDASAPALVKANPAYWNRSLPKSAVQFMSFILPENKQYLQQHATELWQKKNNGCYEAKFEATLDIMDFPALIDR